MPDQLRYLTATSRYPKYAKLFVNKMPSIPVGGEQRLCINLNALVPPNTATCCLKWRSGRWIIYLYAPVEQPRSDNQYTITKTTPHVPVSIVFLLENHSDKVRILKRDKWYLSKTQRARAYRDWILVREIGGQSPNWCVTRAQIRAVQVYALRLDWVDKLVFFFYRESISFFFMQHAANAHYCSCAPWVLPPILLPTGLRDETGIFCNIKTYNSPNINKRV